MSERFSKLFALPENLYCHGAPVMIAAGAIQKDNETGRVFGQLKLRNIQEKGIKAVKVCVSPFDTAGKPLGGAIEHQYLDLSAARDADFGPKSPIKLADGSTRSFTVTVAEVVTAFDEFEGILAVSGLVLGLLCVVTSWPLYAFGQLVEDVHAMRTGGVEKAPVSDELPDL